MIDQLLVKENLNRWFWCWGVLTLSLLYIGCLFAALLILHDVADDTIWQRDLTALESKIRYFYNLLGLIFFVVASFMVVWSVFVAIKVFLISSKLSLPNRLRFYMRISVIVCPIMAFASFIFIVGILRLSDFGYTYQLLFHKFLTQLAIY